MRAVRVHRPDGPEVLQIEEIPLPAARQGWVRIRIRASGLNRSELLTRQGHSPSVRFPRVLGIECVGEVDDAGGTDLIRGQKVAALMGEMGRAYDGGYAEYTLVPRDRVGLPAVLQPNVAGERPMKGPPTMDSPCTSRSRSRTSSGTSASECPPAP